MAASAPKPEDQAPAQIAEEPTNGFKKDRFQLSFDLDGDGNPDLAGMRESTRVKVKEFFSNPKMAAAFGSKPAGLDATPKVHPAAVRGLYFTLGSIEAMITPLIIKQIKPDVARQVFMYTDKELEALEGPTVAVLNKYADWFIKYQDEIALATMICTMTMNKVQAAIILSKGSQAQSAPDGKKPGEGAEGSTLN